MGRRFFGHGELHVVILALLAGRAMHGYDLLGELNRLFGPRYRASAGGVYPALSALESEGLIAGSLQADRVVYRLRRSGREALDKRRHLLAGIEARTGVRLGHGDALDHALVELDTRVRAVAELVDPEAAARELRTAAERIEALASKTHRRNAP